MTKYYGLELDEYDITAYNISVEAWDSMPPEQQEDYIITNNIVIKYSTDISDTLSRGFGHLDQWGFLEYQCKHVLRRFEGCI